MCIFCDIVNDRLQSNVIYRNDYITVILDKFPLAPGHTLILSNEHYDNFLECPEKISCEIAKMSSIVAKAVISSVNADGARILTNIGKSAGQVIFHLHVHIIPSWSDPPSEYKEFEPRKEQPLEYYETLKKVISYNIQRILNRK
ncbi:HIT family protein [Acidianus brierleyi]|uniref:HIT family protein n=1 Tax=Acidianus brierleyi TaxID=41673 RepID=A0A2U9IBT0_9CREN|nr:HIT domain-containing protein [Acidianus brierleyi]AWR93477.1 HIT domain-containing protein [Acidianus brierleyi]